MESRRGYSFLHDHDFGPRGTKTESMQDVVLCSDSEDSEIDVVGTADTYQPVRNVLGPATVAAVLKTIKTEPVTDHLYDTSSFVGEDVDDVVSEYLQPFSSDPQPLSPASIPDSVDIDTKLSMGRLESGAGVANVSEFGAGITGADDFLYDDSLSHSSEDLSACDSVEFEDPFGSLFPSLL